MSELNKNCKGCVYEKDNQKEFAALQVRIAELTMPEDVKRTLIIHMKYMVTTSSEFETTGLPRYKTALDWLQKGAK